MKLSKIFEEKPQSWGLRGDPYFWDYLKERSENAATGIGSLDIIMWIRK